MTAISASAGASQIEASQRALATVDDPAIVVGAPLAADGSPVAGPLMGLPFAVKDNIDVAGVPTTAGCPSRAWVPTNHATAVRRLIEAGAVPVAKTNLDQFATGLVGTRSPLGTPVNPHRADVIPGGSSSGSAVAVARGLVPVALGTDTAGSGRVPAAMCGIVGLKPTCGWISSSGVLPAVPRLDTVSVFATTVAAAYEVAEQAAGFDRRDPYSRARPDVVPGPIQVIGVPSSLKGTGCDDETVAMAEALPGWLRGAGYDVVRVPIDELLAAGRLLYGSALVGERRVSFGALLDGAPDADPVVREVVAGANGYSAADAYEVERRLVAHRRHAQQLFGSIDALVLPTTPGIATLAQVAADPIGMNGWMGTFTTFVNLLDLAALALPRGMRADGVPIGVQLVGPAWSDRALAELGARLLGEPPLPELPITVPGSVEVVVFGAHLTGEPLNPQLVALGAHLEREVRTSAAYRCFDLGRVPGLVRVADGGGPVTGELWSMSAAAFGALTQRVPHPLAIGNVELADGQWVKGFICESIATTGMPDITAHGGWKAYRHSSG